MAAILKWLRNPPYAHIELGFAVDRKAMDFLYLFFSKEVIRWLIKNWNN